MLDDIAEEMVEAMSAGIEDVRAKSDVGADLLAASYETAQGFVRSMEADPWSVPQLPPALADLARTMARRDSDLTALITATRYGQAVFWPAVMRIAERVIQNPSIRMRVLAIAFDRFGRYLETLLEGAVAIFQEERDLRMRGAHARRHETIAALINGEELGVDSASRALGYELRWLHTALALWDSGPAHPGHDSLDRLESLARDVAAAMGTRRVLTTPSGSRGLWAWIATDGPPNREQLGGISALAAPDGVRAAVGQSAPGVPGFRRSHEEALAAQRLVSRNGGDTAVTWYADVEIVSLLSHDARGAQALVARELAGLKGDDPHSAKLRQTTLAFLRCAGSATGAARELGIHTNTVRYRIEQAEDALGRPLQGEQLPLQLALMLGAGLLPDSR
jgi:DNA-binding PucR family transcriptional regulator